MKQKLKLIILAFVALTGVLLLFHSDSVSAKGETWQLVDKTTIKVSGGIFTGDTIINYQGKAYTIGNPASITLKPRDGNGQTSPSIWVATQQFNLQNPQNTNNLEGKPRAQGEFCVDVFNFGQLLSYRTSATFSPIHREDCQKNATDIRNVKPAPSLGQYMQCGWPATWNCNTYWSTSSGFGISGGTKITYAIPGDPLKCGDPGFTGEGCVYDPKTADCSKTNGEAGEGQKCEAIKSCIVAFNQSAEDCAKGWEDCVASYPKDNINYNTCKKFVGKADFEGGLSKDEVTEGGSSCSVQDGIGWVLCPVANTVASFADSLFVVVSGFMRVEPLSLSPNNNPLYTSWSVMRSVANVAFVIVFLIIIFSQLSSLGISNYGVKKMLPRLVVAAILVNISYFICALAVDISNILGVSLQDTFTAIREQTALGTVTSDETTWSSITTLVLGGVGGAVGLVAFTALSSTTISAAIAGLLPLVISALFALIVAFLVLLARQALIIALIVVAPLAFVAFLLPNTENLFKKWRDLFMSLLLLFPLMSIVFGGSQLASSILRESALSPMASDDAGIAITGFFLYIGSLAIQAIPFFLTPVLIKLSGGVLGRFAGLINNPNRGPFDRAKKWAEQRGEDARNKATRNKLAAKPGLLNFGARRKANRTGISESLAGESKRAQTEYLAEATKNSARLRKAMAGTGDVGAGERILAGAINTKLSLRADEMKAATAIAEDLNLSGAQRQDLAMHGVTKMRDKDGNVMKDAQGNDVTYTASETLQKAMIQRQMTTGSYAEQRQIVDASSGEGPLTEFSQIIADTAISSGVASKDPAIAGQRIDYITQKTFDYDFAVKQAFGEGKYTAQTLVTMHNDARQELLRVALAEQAAGNPEMIQSLQAAQTAIEASPEIRGGVAGNPTGLQDLQAIAAGPEAINALLAERERIAAAKKAAKAGG